MESKKNSSLSAAIADLLRLIPTLQDILGDITHLTCQTWRLAKHSLVAIVAYAFIIATLLASTWLSGLVMLTWYLYTSHVSLSLSIVIILSLNVCLILTLLSILCHCKKNLLFKATIKQGKRFYK